MLKVSIKKLFSIVFKGGSKNNLFQNTLLLIIYNNITNTYTAFK